VVFFVTVHTSLAVFLNAECHGFVMVATRPILLPQTEQTIAAGGTISFEVGMIRTGMTAPYRVA